MSEQNSISQTKLLNDSRSAQLLSKQIYEKVAAKEIPVSENKYIVHALKIVYDGSLYHVIDINPAMFYTIRNVFVLQSILNNL